MACQMFAGLCWDAELEVGRVVSGPGWRLYSGSRGSLVQAHEQLP